MQQQTIFRLLVYCFR